MAAPIVTTRRDKAAALLFRYANWKRSFASCIAVVVEKYREKNDKPNCNNVPR